MALVLIDKLPDGQALINTDQIVQARVVHGTVAIYFTNGDELTVPHESVARLYDEITSPENPLV